MAGTRLNAVSLIAQDGAYQMKKFYFLLSHQQVNNIIDKK